MRAMPPNSLLHRRPSLIRPLWAVVLALCVLAAGCAKFPPDSATLSTKRLVFTLTVAGQINPNYVYIVALRPSNLINPTDTGPIPVIGPPWGNGFVAGNATYFVRWDPTTSPAYTLYKFQDILLTQYFAIGIPVAYTDLLPNGKTLSFQIDLTQIATTPDDAAAYQSIQVNFLTMDRVPQGNSGSKAWDALGNGADPAQINDYITIPLTTNGIYNNTRYNNLEPTGDVADPDLDISDFSVEVRSS